VSIALSSPNDESWVRTFSKVPIVTVYFWIVKILTTAMGEAASDFVSHINRIDAFVIGASVFAVALAIQFWVRRYIAWSYWFLVAMVSIFGTMAADGIHKMGVPVYLSTFIFGSLLASVFAVWYRVEGSLSVHQVLTSRKEGFYWLTVFVSFAFGTAAGDWTADTLDLGNLLSGVLFAVLFLLPAIGYWKFGLNEIFAFWFAYVMTRPLGASFADWFDKPASRGGLGMGTAEVSVILTVAIVLFVAYLAMTRKDVEPDTLPLPQD
jgi:uncharacterized membrane-anchored protein